VWDEIFERHEMLRTLFRWEGLNNPLQANVRIYEKTAYKTVKSVAISLFAAVYAIF
jgi:hypothetical protein